MERSLVGYRPWGHEKLDMIKPLTHTHPPPNSHIMQSITSETALNSSLLSLFPIACCPPTPPSFLKFIFPIEP